MVEVRYDAGGRGARSLRRFRGVVPHNVHRVIMIVKLSETSVGIGYENPRVCGDHESLLVSTDSDTSVRSKACWKGTGVLRRPLKFPPLRLTACAIGSVAHILDTVGTAARTVGNAGHSSDTIGSVDDTTRVPYFPQCAKCGPHFRHWGL